MTDDEWNSLDPEYVEALREWVEAEQAATKARMWLAAVWGGAYPEVAGEAYKRFSRGL